MKAIAIPESGECAVGITGARGRAILIEDDIAQPMQTLDVPVGLPELE